MIFKMAAVRLKAGILQSWFRYIPSRTSSNIAFVSRVKRHTYMRMYPTVLVQPDGSTITIRHHEPRQIIKLPLKFEDLTPEEQKIVLIKRKPIEKVVVEEEIEDDFDSRKYLKYIKK
ncbi:large ribosomal subunit protein mL55-like [Ornithodoros turicata]|uniref:large ribosomal subunit protein mL55-like n=1 Tax=Ornithodoros turicata TaxID=34597 RepID=UPI00313A3170